MDLVEAHEALHRCHFLVLFKNPFRLPRSSAGSHSFSPSSQQSKLYTTDSLARAVSGFATVILVLLILSSVIMMSIGILGVYLSKVYDEIKSRQLYVIGARLPQNPASSM